MDPFKFGLTILLAGGIITLYTLVRRFAYARSVSSPHDCPLDHSAAKGPTNSAQQPQGFRLYQVYPPETSDNKSDVDIIAIHGLDTKSPDTWVWKSKEGYPIVGQVRIFMCDWPSSLFENPNYSQKELVEFARLLLDGVDGRPQAAADRDKDKERPILFIASCLGGILLMKALLIADNEYIPVRRATRGIIFLATPFRGTSFKDVANWAELGLRTWAVIRDSKVSKLLQEVKSTQTLTELVRSFTKLCMTEELDRHLAAFYETGNTSLPRKVFPWLPACLSKRKPLVDSGSGTLDIIGHPLALQRSHALMNKFEGPDDPNYDSVARKIETILHNIRHSRPIDRADAHIREKHYTTDCLKIERLSGERLPMEQCYINLTIIKQLGEKDLSLQSSANSLATRLKIKTPKDNIQVELPALFDQRQINNEIVIKPKRVLIRGSAGVGKSTLCKKIVHDFINHGRWNDKFARVLWLPLRNLKTEPKEEIS
ncbi:nacht nucleoside triphosphatase [Apiospora phragmitis]|uniref:Nacht nucleoside triphosphatase n=1 Tax=Apiospora phragmitis TaxID=2905665 RepID=A0ABR1UJA6_9PEZI